MIFVRYYWYNIWSSFEIPPILLEVAILIHANAKINPGYLAPNNPTRQINIHPPSCVVPLTDPIYATGSLRDTELARLSPDRGLAHFALSSRTLRVV